MKLFLFLLYQQHRQAKTNVESGSRNSLAKLCACEKFKAFAKLFSINPKREKAERKEMRNKQRQKTFFRQFSEICR